MAQFHAIAVALAFNAFDLLTGFIGALKNKDIESSKLRDGMFKKVGFIFCYILAFLLDTQGQYIGVSLGVQVLPVIVAYTCLTEAVSIIENVSKINPDLVPEKLLELFHIKQEN